MGNPSCSSYGVTAATFATRSAISFCPGRRFTMQQSRRLCYREIRLESQQYQYQIVRLVRGVSVHRNSESFRYHSPTVIGIELSHGSGCFRRSLSQVLLEKHAVLIDDECHHSRITVLRRIRHECESAGHLPVDHVVFRAAIGATALFGQHMKKVAMEWRVGIWLYGIPLVSRERYHGSERAL